MRLLFTLIFLTILSFSKAHCQGWQWARGNTGGQVDGFSVATDNSGNVFVGGEIAEVGGVLIKDAVFSPVTIPFSNATPFGAQTIIAKYDASGNLLWAIGSQNGDTRLIDIETDRNGNIFVFGTFYSKTVRMGSITLTNTIYPKEQYYLIKFDPSGNVIWARNDGNAKGGLISSYSNTTGGITTDLSGNVYITSDFSLSSVSIGGNTLTNSNPLGGEDIFIVKYDPLGNIVWAKSFGGIDRDYANGITVTAAGDIYIVGTFESPSITFGSTVFTKSGSGGKTYMARLDAAGNCIWATTNSSIGVGDYFIGVVSDLSNNVYVIGGIYENSVTYNGTTIINPTPQNTSILNYS